MKATYLSHMGSDLTVANAARVSFAKESFVLSEKDRRLIAYLAREGHWTPFAHPHLSFHCEAPIFVARQLAKHQVGGVWNEMSRRYVDEEPTFYYPTWRERTAEKKQGSGGELPPEISLRLDWKMDVVYEQAIMDYRTLLACGVCPEQARVVLPQGTMTEWHWTGSLLFFARVCRLRLAPDAQQETRMLVEQIAEQIAPLFPESWQALTGDLSDS